ncbi:MAG: tRNA (adenosine(37)-N6)-dimethylallyltransferase MiaA [Treponema sp.]|nr:tRNA (adenosine(37)-N6)-dimethylallyltransferase MiaA [Treponema sp.]
MDLGKPQFRPLPVLILFGPTASGKTALADKLFSGPDTRLNDRTSIRTSGLCRAEIISADSMQVYRGMDIGTAKPDTELRKRLPHHLIDIRNPNEQFNAGDFVRLADAACRDIADRSALPVILGGTGFYLKNFIFGLPAAPPSNPALQKQLRAELAQRGPEVLLEELSRLDPVSAERIHLNDSYRILRALEVCRSSGQPLSSFSGGKITRPFYHFVTAGLQWPREELNRRIDERCEEMFRRGLAEEAAALFRQGYTPDDPGLRAIGYREFFIETGTSGKWALSKDLEGVKSLVARNSRRYAKRQETFFASIPEVVWLPGKDLQTGVDLLSSLIHNLFNQTP